MEHTVSAVKMEGPTYSSRGQKRPSMMMMMLQLIMIMKMMKMMNKMCVSARDLEEFKMLVTTCCIHSVTLFKKGNISNKCHVMRNLALPI
jgi:hypothetical protein